MRLREPESGASSIQPPWADRDDLARHAVRTMACAYRAVGDLAVLLMIGRNLVDGGHTCFRQP